MDAFDIEAFTVKPKATRASFAILQHYKLSTNTTQKKRDAKYNHVKTAILKA